MKSRVARKTDYVALDQGCFAGRIQYLQLACIPGVVPVVVDNLIAIGGLVGSGDAESIK